MFVSKHNPFPKAERSLGRIINNPSGIPEAPFTVLRLRNAMVRARALVYLEMYEQTCAPAPTRKHTRTQ